MSHRKATIVCAALLVSSALCASLAWWAVSSDDPYTCHPDTRRYVFGAAVVHTLLLSFYWTYSVGFWFVGFPGDEGFLTTWLLIPTALLVSMFVWGAVELGQHSCRHHAYAAALVANLVVSCATILAHFAHFMTYVNSNGV